MLCKRIASVVLLAGILITGFNSTVTSQSFSFGKNRVQYQEFDWKYIRSEHFDIYYYGSENYYLASFSAQSLESALKQIQEDFQFQISNRISVIIYDSHNDFSQTNVVSLPVMSEGIGGVTELYKNRVILPFMGEYGDFRSTIHHELIHAVMNDMFYGGSVQSIIQNNVQLRIPNWFNEGIAEYSSIGFDTNTDNFLRDATINGYMPPIQQLYGYFWYRGGQSVWNYIVKNYGRAKVGEIFQRIKSTRSVEMGFRQSIGLSVEELSERWQKYLKKRYMPELATRDDINDISTQLTKRELSGSYNTSPAVSPQGDRVAVITNQRGYFDVVVISAITGKKLKTLIYGQDNVNFEELNILNPNLSWSPNGDKIALSTKSGGKDNLAIVDYETGNIKMIKFPKLDAMKSVSWSPDGKKIAFQATANSFPDIFVYNLETEEFVNLTRDAFTDSEPNWTMDSESVIFVSDRGGKTQLNTYRENYNVLLNPNLHQKDLYLVTVGENRARRLTDSPKWNEMRPQAIEGDKVLFISDQNGIPNVYEMNLKTKTSFPLTNLLQGVTQMSANKDGSRVAVNTYNGGYLDVFLLKNLSANRFNKALEPNQWAERRAEESEYERVPAVKYAYQMFGGENGLIAYDPQSVTQTGEFENLSLSLNNTLASIQQGQGNTADSTGGKQKSGKSEDSEIIDFRNYQFGDTATDDNGEKGESGTGEAPDSTEINYTLDDGRYIPYDYKLKFAPDLVVSQGTFGTYYGASGLTQLSFTDVLGDHRFGLASNLVFDLRNSSYQLSYSYLKQRTNWHFSYFHYATRYQTIDRNFSLQQVRYRNYGAELTFEYPFDLFRRINYGLSFINISRDFNSLYSVSGPGSDRESFLLPAVTYTSDFTKPGFLTPSGGYRYALSLNGSPPITPSNIGFGTIMGDFRHYLGFGNDYYSIATRLSGAASFGPNAQTFFLGGLDGWFNYRWNGNEIPFDQITDILFTQLAYPMRGFAYNTLYGDKYTLANIEFRFPLFAAILPGPIPILPLYNLTGVFFTDFGAAWGIDQQFSYYRQNSSTGEIEQVPFYTNEASLDFRLSKEETVYIDNTTGEVVDSPQAGGSYFERNIREGDLLLGMGFGVRTILLGLPFRYDVGWPRNRDGFGDPIHYISIGIDF